MPSGFQSITDSGIVQIDETYRNLHLVASASGYIGTPGIDQFHNRFAACSQFAIAAWNFYGGTGGMVFVGSNAGSRSTAVLAEYGSTNVLAQWYIFDFIAPKTLSNVGMEVFNENGEMVFSSTDYPMRIIDRFEKTGFIGGSVPADETIYTNNTGRQIAFLPYRSNYYYDYDSIDLEVNDFFLRVEGNRLIANSMYSLQEFPSISAHFRTPIAAFMALVVDVTGLPANYSR